MTNGDYGFAGVAPGDYSVTVAATPVGLVPSLCNVGSDDLDNDCSPATVTVVAGGPPDLTVDFGFAGTGSIGDRVWVDENCDGLQDPGEADLDGVRVVLTDAGGVDREQLTVSGAYSFQNLCAGAYTVTVDASTLPPGFAPAPSDVGPNDALDSDGSPVTVMLATDGSRDDTVDFGFCPPSPGSLGDFVWRDLNGDGLQDVGEPGLPGVQVLLKDLSGNVLASTLTDDLGRYAFPFLPPGDYAVEVVAPVCAVAAPCNVGSDDTLDSDCSPAFVTVTSGVRDDSVDFGFVAFGTGSIGDFVWNDLNADGLQDPGELGFQGAQVDLFDSGGALLASQLTGPAGEYLFQGLCAGQYVVRVDLNLTGMGFVRSPCDVGADDAIDNDCSPAVVVLSADDERNTTLDFGYHSSLPLEGLGAGSWRDHPAAWPPSPPPTTPFASVFVDAFPGLSLHDVLLLRGPGRAAAGREAVAALLNARAGGVGYPLPEHEVVARFAAAQRGDEADREALRRFLAARNALGSVRGSEASR